MPPKTPEPKRIVIVGGGQSAYSCLRALQEQTRNQQPLPMMVEVIEAGDKFVRGLAWDEKNLRPFHAINTYMDAEEAILKALSVHPEWGPLLKHKPAGEVSRIMMGKYYEHDFHKLVGELETQGIKVKLSPHTVVEDVYREDGFIVKTKNLKTGNEVEKAADYVVMATGHWQDKSPLNLNKGVFASPWPASRLEQEVDCAKPVAVMGTSLSGVDAMLTLGHHAGRFERVGEKLKYTPHNMDFKIVAYSPHGMLPPVLGSVRAYKPTTFKLGALKDKQGFIPLDRVYRVCVEKFIEQYAPSESRNPTFIQARALLENDSLKIEEVASAVYHAYAQDKTATLQHQLAEAKESIKRKEPILSQEFLRKLATEMEYAYNLFSAEDQQRFLQEVRPLYAKFAYGMVISNAEEILAMMEAGCLDVKALGKEYSLSTKQDEGSKLPGAEIRYRDERGAEHNDYFPAVVKAGGDDLHQLKESSPLMKKMFGSGIITEMVTPYKNQAAGKAEYEREKLSAGEVKKTRLIEGEYYRANGGIFMDLVTNEAIPHHDYRGNDKNLFVMGEAVACHFPLLHGIGAMRMASAKIIHSIITSMQQQQGPAVKERPDGLLIVATRGPNEIMAVVEEKVLRSPDKEAAVRSSISKQMGGDPADVQLVSIEAAPPELWESLAPFRPRTP